jgi:hypothetical protein
LDSTDLSRPKTDYIKDPSGDFTMGAAEKHIINENDLKIARIGGEPLPEPLLVAHSTPSTPYPSAI